MDVVTYGRGGYDANQQDNNVVATAVVTIPVEQTNLETLLARAQTALANNKTFLAIASPTNAQAVAQVQAVTRQVNALIRLQIGALSDTTGT